MNDGKKLVHFAHCYQGEYVGSCKYGDCNCPAHKEIEQDQLTAANKAIVALSEALESAKQRFNLLCDVEKNGVRTSVGYDEALTTLTTHADTIKRAKESV